MKCFKDTLDVALQYKNLPLYVAKSISETLMLWRPIRLFVWQYKKGSRRKNYLHACTLYQAEGEQMMAEDSRAPTGQILPWEFCGLKDPVDLSGAAAGAVCKGGPWISRSLRRAGSVMLSILSLQQRVCCHGLPAPT